MRRRVHGTPRPARAAARTQAAQAEVDVRVVPGVTLADSRRVLAGVARTCRPSRGVFMKPEVLHLEDDPDWRDLLGKQLEPRPLWSVGTVAEATEALKTRPIFAAIVDLNIRGNPTAGL